MTSRQVLRAVNCGLFSLLIAFVAVPMLPACPDPVWMALRVLGPVTLAPALLGWEGRRAARLVWLGLPVQYLVLFLGRAPIARHLGISLAGLGGLTYFGEAALWPLIITAAQSLTLHLWGRKTEPRR